MLPAPAPAANPGEALAAMAAERMEKVLEEVGLTVLLVGWSVGSLIG